MAKQNSDSNVVGALRDRLRGRLLRPGDEDYEAARRRGGSGSNYTRIREVKARYDPDNVFSHGLKIPAGR